MWRCTTMAVPACSTNAAGLADAFTKVQGSSSRSQCCYCCVCQPSLWRWRGCLAALLWCQVQADAPAWVTMLPMGSRISVNHHVDKLQAVTQYTAEDPTCVKQCGAPVCWTSDVWYAHTTHRRHSAQKNCRTTSSTGHKRMLHQPWHALGLYGAVGSLHICGHLQPNACCLVGGKCGNAGSAATHSGEPTHPQTRLFNISCQKMHMRHMVHRQPVHTGHYRAVPNSRQQLLPWLTMRGIHLPPPAAASQSIIFPAAQLVPPS